MVPLVTHVGKKKRSFTVYPLSQYTARLAKRNWVHHWTRAKFTPASLRALFGRVS